MPTVPEGGRVGAANAPVAHIVGVHLREARQEAGR